MRMTASFKWTGLYENIAFTNVVVAVTIFLSNLHCDVGCLSDLLCLHGGTICLMIPPILSSLMYLRELYSAKELYDASYSSVYLRGQPFSQVIRLIHLYVRGEPFCQVIREIHLLVYVEKHFAR